MVYAESLRHFVQEWLKIEPPKRFKDWPWTQTIWLLNLYAQSSSQVVSRMPCPFITIMLNDSDVRRGQMVNESLIVYKGYFTKGDFCVPRRYVLSPDSNSERTFRTNRYAYTSDGYGRYIHDWNKADLRLIEFMGSNRHTRRNLYGGDACVEMLMKRLSHLSGANDMTYRIAENVLDFSETMGQDRDAQHAHSVETMIIAAPTTGLLDPIRKSREYKLINGSIAMNQDDVFITIPLEPCAQEYEKVINPLQDFPGAHVRPLRNICHSVVYCCVECPMGIFRFQEYFPSMVVQNNDHDYCRLVSHSFTLGTEADGANIHMRLRHYITEGLMPKNKSTRPFLEKHREKLFQRSDLPPGVTIGKDGSVNSSIQ